MLSQAGEDVIHVGDARSTQKMLTIILMAIHSSSTIQHIAWFRLYTVNAYAVVGRVDKRSNRFTLIHFLFKTVG